MIYTASKPSSNCAQNTTKVKNAIKTIFHHKSPAEPQVFRGHLTLKNTRCEGEFLPVILGAVKI